MQSKENRSTTLAPSRGLSLPHFDEILNRPQMGIGSFVWCRNTNRVALAANMWRMLDSEPVFEPVSGSLWRFIHVSHQRRARRDLKMAEMGRKETFNGLYRMRISDERILMCALRGRIRYEDQRATRVEGVAIDVTSVPRLLMEMTTA